MAALKADIARHIPRFGGVDPLLLAEKTPDDAPIVRIGFGLEGALQKIDAVLANKGPSGVLGWRAEVVHDLVLPKR